MRVRLIMQRESSGDLASPEGAFLRLGEGLSGTVPKHPERAISLLAAEALPLLPRFDGLCTGKFRGDIITEGLDFSALSVGTRLAVGGGVVRITAKKSCYDQCPLRQLGETCPLPESCAFAAVEAEGAFSPGDEIRIL